MDKNQILGIVLIFFGTGFILYITLRSRNIIRRIAKRRTGSTRELLQEMNREQ